MAESNLSRDQSLFNIQAAYDIDGASTTDPSSTDSRDQSPVLVREILVLLLLVILSDLTLYRAEGFAGPAAFFLIAPLLLYLGSVRSKWDLSVWVVTPMLVLLSVRLVWCGSWLAEACGYVLFCCFAMSLSGLRPYLSRATVFAAQRIGAGYRGLQQYVTALLRLRPALLRNHWLAFVLPVIPLLTFTSIFILANPDLVTELEQRLDQFLKVLEEWLLRFHFAEVLFCFGAGWVAIGLLRPGVNGVEEIESRGDVREGSATSTYYDAYRNSLVVVIGLFAMYLAFEFQTLWFKSFPQGFHYSGYAHEGAAWLTVALGLATVMLSFIFRGSILTDPRLSRLRILSWIWSIENLLLAVAVFNRLFIYIGFNGMTRMRVVGMLGVASVIAGFILVLRKIARNHTFTWLIRRHVWAVAFAVYLYAVLPVDAFVNQYNVSRILAGDPRPSVQLSVHPTSDEGRLCWKPLMDCSDPIIRDGIQALLDQRLDEFEALARRSDSTSEQDLPGWTAGQLASDRLFSQLRSLESKSSDASWRHDADASRRQSVINKFHEYAFQWY